MERVVDQLLLQTSSVCMCACVCVCVCVWRGINLARFGGWRGLESGVGRESGPGPGAGRVWSLVTDCTAPPQMRL